MTRYLLDTNILSNGIKPRPSEPLLEWLAQEPDDFLFVAAVTIAEIKRGILEMPLGRRRAELETWFDGPKGPRSFFADRILPFDEAAGLVWAAFMAEGKLRARPRDAIDMIIASTAEIHGCIIVTDNERDFAGLNFINPLRQAQE